MSDRPVDPASAGTLAPLHRAVAGMSGLTALSRATGFARVLLVTAVLGTTYLGSTYQAANTVPNIAFELFAAGALHAVLVPTLVGVLDEQGRAASAEVAGKILGAVAAGLAVLTVAAMALSPVIMRILAAGVDDSEVRSAQVRLGTVFLLVFLPQVVLYGWGLVATAVLHSRQRFAAAAGAPIANNLVVMLAYLAFWALAGDPTAWPGDPLSPVEVAVLAGGTTLAVLAMTAVPVLALAREGTWLRPRWAPRDPVVRRLGRHGGWAVGQVAAAQGLLLAVLVLANGAEGGVVVFQFAFSFFLLPFALVAVPVATAIAPALRRLVREPVRFSQLGGRAVVAVSAILLPASAALAALAWPLVRVTAFGQATASGLSPLAHSLMALGPGLVGYGLLLVLTRASYARDDPRTPALVTAAACLVAVAVMVFGADQFTGDTRVVFLAGVHSFAYLAAAGALWWRFGRVGAGLGVGTATTVAGLAAAAVAAGLVMATAVALVDPQGRWLAAGVAAAAGAAGLAVYLGLVHLWGRRLPQLLRLEVAGRADG